MKTYKMLDISTGHITQKDSELLEDPKSLAFTCAQYGEGFILNLSIFEHESLIQSEKSKFSPEFFIIIANKI